MTAAIAFENNRTIARGALADVAASVRKRAGRETHENIAVFDLVSGRTLHLDLTGSETDIRARYAPRPVLPEAPGADAPRGPGRPRLGVVAREVTLLPRHWDWLATQPGGASVALRKLVEDARKSQGQSDSLRAGQEAAYRFISAIAGDWPNFEDSTRALFAGDEVRFRDLTDTWPTDVRDHARHLASAAFPPRKT
jgi:hypothetical protein